MRAAAFKWAGSAGTGRRLHLQTHTGNGKLAVLISSGVSWTLVQILEGGKRVGVREAAFNYCWGTLLGLGGAGDQGRMYDWELGCMR